jgi:predicted phage terminase large subunit-like protein
LWTRDLIEECRIDKASLPPMKRIVVAIDPAISVSETSDETGIVVCGLGSDGKGYVLADESGRYLPIEWATKAVALYKKYNADRIVAEANQGGAMVETTIRTVDANVSYKGVHASRGKITRAEPVAALSEQHRILFVGTFPPLEDQLCEFAAGSADSPDRLDALVWAITELMVDFQAQVIPMIMPIVLGVSMPTVPHGYYGSSGEARAYGDKRSSGFTITRAL